MSNVNFSNHLIIESNQHVSLKSLVITKIASAFVLAACSILAGVLPLGISLFLDKGMYDSEEDVEKGKKRKEKVVTLMMSFAGGVLLCTVFLHLLPEVSELFEDHSKEWARSLPEFMPQALLCAGFFIMFFVEEVANSLISTKDNTQQMDTTSVKSTSRSNRTLSPYEGNPDEVKSIFCRNVISVTTEASKNLSFAETQKIINFILKALEENYAAHLRELDPDTCCPIRDLEFKERAIITQSEEPSGDRTRSSVRSFLLTLALSVHSLFEGMAIGLENQPSSVWLMLMGVGAHKVVLSSCMGIEMVASGIGRCLHLSYVFMFAVVSPIGIVAGLLLSAEYDALSAIFQGLASGTLLYVLFFEVLKYQRHLSGLLSFVAVLVGFALMTALQIFADD